MLLECYIGDDGIAHKVIKGYIGVNGVAKKIYDPEIVSEFTKVSSVSSLGSSRYSLAATSVGNYALFGGGYFHNKSNSMYGSKDNVDAYTSNLVRSTASSLSIRCHNLAATTVGNYALFGGGYYLYTSGEIEYSVSTVDTYTNNLVKSTASSLNTAREGLAATTVGNYALFGGGGGSYSSVVDTYTNNLVHSTASSLNTAREGLAATTVGNYALFGGGNYYLNSTTYKVSIVDTYTNNLVHSTATLLNTARSILAATTVGNYALFGGGYSSSYSSVVDTYTNNLVHSTATSLNTARYSLAATTVGNYALFGGGGGSYSSVVDTYTNNLVHSTASSLNTAREGLAATTVGNYALFGGGYNGTNSDVCSNTVDAYKYEVLYYM